MLETIYKADDNFRAALRAGKRFQSDAGWGFAWQENASQEIAATRRGDAGLGAVLIKIIRRTITGRFEVHFVCKTLNHNQRYREGHKILREN